MTQILDPDFLPPNEADLKLKIKPLDDGKNPRLLIDINLPARQAFFEIIEDKDGQAPPYAICVVRADHDLIALGVLEKLKALVMIYEKKLRLGAKLSEGVREAAGHDLTKVAGRSS